MFLRSCIFFLLCFSIGLEAQEKALRIEMFHGTNRIFAGESLSKTRFGYSGAIGISFKYKRKNSALSFEPQLFFLRNTYRFYINEFYTIKIIQRQLSLIPMAGLSISERTALKVGLFFNSGEASTIELVYRNNSVYYATSESSLTNNYQPRMFQSGFALGMSFILGRKKNWNFNLLVLQFASPFLASEYVLNEPGKYPPVTTNISSRSRPTIIMAGFSYKLEKAFGAKKEKKVDE